MVDNNFTVDINSLEGNTKIQEPDACTYLHYTNMSVPWSSCSWFGIQSDVQPIVAETIQLFADDIKVETEFPLL